MKYGTTETQRNLERRTPPPADLPPVADIGLRTFAQINATMSGITGVPALQAAVSQTYQAVQQ